MGVTSVCWCYQHLGAKIGMLISSAALNRIDLYSTKEIADVVDTNINVTMTNVIQSILVLLQMRFPIYCSFI